MTENCLDAEIVQACEVMRHTSCRIDALNSQIDSLNEERLRNEMHHTTAKRLLQQRLVDASLVDPQDDNQKIRLSALIYRVHLLTAEAARNDE